MQRGVFPIQSHFSPIHKISSFQPSHFFTFYYFGCSILSLSIVTDLANLPVVRELYTSLHLPTLVCLGSNGPVGPIYSPHLCIMDKRCRSQHSRASPNSILSLKLTVQSWLKMFLSFPGQRYLVESCEVQIGPSLVDTKCTNVQNSLSHFLEADILLKAANRPILPMMTLRPNSLAVGANFCRQFWVNSNKIKKIFKFLGRQDNSFCSLLTINSINQSEHTFCQ